MMVGSFPVQYLVQNDGRYLHAMPVDETGMMHVSVRLWIRWTRGDNAVGNDVFLRGRTDVAMRRVFVLMLSVLYDIVSFAQLKARNGAGCPLPPPTHTHAKPRSAQQNG